MSRMPNNLISLLTAGGRGKQTIERHVAELALGIVAALRSGELPVERAWDELFNLENYRAARRKRMSRPLLELLEWGLELENVAEVTPRALPQSYAQIEQLAQQVIRRASAEPPRRLRKSA